MSANADMILGDLLGKLSKGENILDKKPAKKKRQRLINEEDKFTYRLHEPTMKSIALVLEKHVYECNCGAKHEAPNLHILCIKEDKNKNRHETQFFTKSDIDELPRMIRPVVFKVQACAECFESAELTPVCTDEAKDRIEEVKVDEEINKLLMKWDEEGK